MFEYRYTELDIIDKKIARIPIFRRNWRKTKRKNMEREK